MQDRYRELCDAFHWQVPQRFNVARECCGRWARERHRFALYYEVDAGVTTAWTYWDLQQQANRLSNALNALGVKRGDRVAIILPQRPETAIAHIACYQMGAIAMPLAMLFGADALEYRLQDSEAVAALVDAASLPNLTQIRERLPRLRHVIGVEGAREKDVHAYERLLEKSSRHFECVDTSAEDPALLIYTSGTTGPPKGALNPHRVLLGNLPYAHPSALLPGSSMHRAALGVGCSIRLRGLVAAARRELLALNETPDQTGKDQQHDRRDRNLSGESLRADVVDAKCRGHRGNSRAGPAV